MKLLKRDENGCLFLIGKRERELLVNLLRRYPVISGTHYRERHPSKTSVKVDHDALLQEALAEQQKETRLQLDAMLAEAGRFRETELGFNFQLKEAELEWLLQVLNDIRVGSWIHLGEPDSKSNTLPAATEANVQLAWAMEMAGLFEHSLLEASAS